ncbi:hypothetical protein [Curtobacterium sp. MCSS17_016]|uniref:hypothetical protein n=1 Tax=Curtobacterium sp. MCSS17_016 TaxID=2175644 RepID=UPI0011B4FB3A|nr:hypothetical protein [Curtobacterium sp. MCSS17_016]WIE80887.1 hypothetical protein DEJ19_020435 [Curtobacterium sp. MCSS17_016]
MIAAIAVSLVLLVGGSFAVAGVLDRGHDLNAKDMLSKVAAAEAAVAGGGGPQASWEAAPHSSASTLGGRRNEMPNPDLAAGLDGWATSTSWEGKLEYDGVKHRGRYTWMNSSQATSGTQFLGFGFQSQFRIPVDSAKRSAQMTVWNRAASVRTFRVQLSFYDAAGTFIDRNPATTGISIAGGSSAAVWRNGIIPPAGAVSYSFGLVSTVDTLQPGDVVEFTDTIVEKADQVGSYFDGGSGGASGFLPYLTESASGHLGYGLTDFGGVSPADALAQGPLGFTPADGVRVGVLTDSGGSGWVAAAKSATGKLFLRSSASSAVAEATRSGGSWVVPAGLRLPTAISAADVTTALTAAGGF